TEPGDIMRNNKSVTAHKARAWTATVLLAALSQLPEPALAQGPEVGRALAERWCSSCHIIDRAPATATANGLPSFPAIAAKPSTTKQSLDQFLSSEHTRMP